MGSGELRAQGGEAQASAGAGAERITRSAAAIGRASLARSGCYRGGVSRNDGVSPSCDLTAKRHFFGRREFGTPPHALPLTGELLYAPSMNIALQLPSMLLA